MTAPEKLLPAAPEVFDKQYKPSELADLFKDFADKMIDKGFAVRHGEAVIPKIRGPSIYFNNDGTVETVSFRHRPQNEIIDYRIAFSPEKQYRQTYEKDGSVASFSIRSFNEFGKAKTLCSLERSLLKPRDAGVNTFFHELAAAIRS